MKKVLIAALGAAFAFAMSTVHAGVAPALGGNKMSQSGAKVAPAKPAPEESKNDTQHDDKEKPKQ